MSKCKEGYSRAMQTWRHRRIFGFRYGVVKLRSATKHADNCVVELFNDRARWRENSRARPRICMSQRILQLLTWIAKADKFAPTADKPEDGGFSGCGAFAQLS